MFSDEKQFDLIKDTNKIFYLMSSEYFADSDCTDHQITLSETNSEYTLHRKNHSTSFKLARKEKFFEDFNIYTSYKTYASLYSYYYIISETEPKPNFWHRICPDANNQDFSSEASILFILETEVFKIIDFSK